MPAGTHILFGGVERIGEVPFHVQTLGGLGKNREVALVGASGAAEEFFVVFLFGIGMQSRGKITGQQLEVVEHGFFFIGGAPPIFVAGSDLGQHHDVVVGVGQIFGRYRRLVHSLGPFQVAVDVVADANELAVHLGRFFIHRLDLKTTSQFLQCCSIF